MLDAFNRGCLSYVPSQGTVGASGGNCYSSAAAAAAAVANANANATDDATDTATIAGL